MAFDDSQDQADDDENQQAQANQPAGQESQLSGGGGFAGSNAAPSGQSSSSSASPAPGGAPAASAPGTYDQGPTSSGSWTNLNSYLSANADQAPALGQTIANTVGTQAGQAESDLNSVQQGFENQTPFTNINNTTTGDVDQAFSNVGQYAPTTGTNGISTPSDTSVPETWLNNNWGINSSNSDMTQYAPTTGTAPSWSTVQNDYNTANQNLQDTQTESGQDVLLQNQFGQNGQQYNAGEQNFDDLLLQQNPANQTALNSVYNQYAPNEMIAQASTTNPTQNAAAQAGESTDIYNALQGSQNYVANEQNAALGIQNQATGDLSNQIGNLGTSVTGEIGTDSSNYQNEFNQLQTGLQDNNLSAAQLQELGLTQGENLYGANPDSFLTENANPYSGTGAANAAATAGDWNNFQGITALLGGYSGTNQATDLSQLGQVGLTGTQPTTPVSSTPYSFNNTNFNNAVTSGQASYNAAYNSPTAPGLGAVSISNIGQWDGSELNEASQYASMVGQQYYDQANGAGSFQQLQQQLAEWNAANPNGTLQ
jgi:hypothetical protein